MYILTNLINLIKRLYNESDCLTISAYESIYMHDEPVVIVGNQTKLHNCCNCGAVMTGDQAMCSTECLDEAMSNYPLEENK